MKILAKVLIGIGILLVVVVVVAALFLGPIIKAGVETAGPKIAGVDMTLGKASVNLLTGNVRLKGLVIGNPEGFKTPSLMELNQFVVDLKMSSLFTDTIVVKKIHIDGPQITYERGLKASNLSALQKNLAPAEAAPAKETVAEKPATEKKAPAKKVVIEDFLFENGKVNVSITLAGGKQLTVPLMPIHLKDIGKESDGASIPEVINEVFGAITKSVGQAVASSADFAGNLAGDAGSALKDASGSATDAAKDAAGAATDAAKGAADSLKKLGGSLFGK
ncbi:MAG: AsmA family protein [Verrucomicrobia bacterium]|nr:AsmA family protein [Verrucomicrobiota bacterium]